jgi:hypothetical protein
MDKIQQEFQEKLDKLYEKWRDVEPIKINDKEWYIQNFDANTAVEKVRSWTESKVVGGPIDVDLSLIHFNDMGYQEAEGKLWSDGELKITFVNVPYYSADRLGFPIPYAPAATEWDT